MILDALHTGLLGSVLVVGGIALHEHEAHVREAAIANAVQQAQATYQKQLAQQAADREAAYQAQLKSVESRVQKAQTPVDVAALATQIMALKQPVQIVTPAPTAAEPKPEPIAQVPLLDADQVKAYINVCEQDKLYVPKLEADNTELKAQVASVMQQRDAARTEAKGGKLGHRIVTALKYVGIGVGIGVVLGGRF
jgi:hypothetical protein